MAQQDAARDEQWELCEMRLRMRPAFGSIAFIVEAVVTSPRGQYVAATRRFNRLVTAGLDASRKMNDQRTSLTNQLVSEGWEPLPSVSTPLHGRGYISVMLPRFRRRVVL